MTTQQGSSGNDVLTGTDGDDTLLGLTGSDSIFGGRGNDQIEIRDDGSSDTLDGGAGGWDSLWFRGAITSPLVLGANIMGFENIVVDPEGAAITQLVVVTDAAFIGSENGRIDLSVWSYESNQVEVDASAVTVGGLTIYGTNGNDTLRGGARDDVLAGNMGDDWLESGAGYDVLWGHRGDDTLDGGDDRDAVVYQLGLLTSFEFQNLYLEVTGPQAWVFGSGTDVWFTIQRVNGSDDLVVTDNRSASSVRDGSEPHGVDVLRAIEELAFEAQYAGAGWDRVTPQIYGVRAANIAISNDEGMLNLTLEDHNVVLGTNAADTLFGEIGSDHIAALDGDDRISAGAGNDRIIVLHDIGGDVIDGGLGEDVLQVVTYGRPMVVGANVSSIERIEIDPVESSSGQQLTILDEAVRNRIGDDGRLYSVSFWGQNSAGVLVDAGTVVSAGLTITTSNGNDTIDGTLGDDQFWVFAGNDQVSGNDGNDHIDGEFGNDLLNGGSGNDTLLGGPGDDTLLGGGGDDRFHGGPGSDVLDGGEQKRVPWLVSTSGDYDRLDYGSTAGITVDLLARTVVVTAEEGADNYAGIEEIVGAYNGADTITGRLTNSVADAEFGTAMYLYLQGGGDTVVQDGYGYQQNWADGVLVGYHWSQTGIDLTYVGDRATVTYGASGNQIAGQDTLTRVVLIGDSAHEDHFDLSQATINHRGYVADPVRGAGWHTLLLGRGGNDTVVGNGLTSVHYGSVNATSDGNGLILDLKAGSADLSNLSTNGVALGTLTFSGVRGITGTRFNDTLIGGLAANDPFESFRGDGGDDDIDGGSGFDRASYRWSTDGVNVQLAAGVASSASSGIDTLRSIESIQGSMFADVYDARGFWGGSTSASANVGSFGSGFNEFQPEGGDDVIHGNGKTRLDYDSVMVAVRVDLRDGVADARLESDKSTSAYLTMGRDIFTGVYDVRGSQFDDELIGGNPANGSGAYDGDERFRGNAGNDTIDGGSGFDIAYYDNSPTAVQVTLGGWGDGVAHDGWGFVDVLREIQEVVGSHFADQLNGSNDNVFESLEGRGGDDTLTGGAGTTRASYVSSPSGAVVDLAAGAAQDGWGGTDTLISIDWVRGSEHADAISGSDVEWGEAFEPRGGNDTVDGRGGTDQVRYNHAPSAVQVDLAAGTANDGTGGVDTLISIENVYATNYNDSVVGSSDANVLEGLSGHDTLFGGAGDDTLYGGDGDDLLAGNGGMDVIDGGNGFDIVTYYTAAGGVSVNLADQFTSDDGHGGTDSLSRIEMVWGSAYNDMLVGGLAANGTGATGGFEGFQGFAGDDTIDGGQGFDRAYYTDSPTAVTVQLGGYNAGSAQDGYGSVDTLISIEEVRGSAFNDLLMGSDDPLFESYEGRQGNDTINGGVGTDRISFQTSPNGVVVDLAAGTAQDGWGGTDTFSGIENIRGSDHGDLLIGDDGANHVDDRAGNDTVHAGGGADTVLGSAGNDLIDTGSGLDFVIYKSSPSAIQVDMRLAQGQVQDGWGGVDTLIGVEHLYGSEFADVVIGPSASQGFWYVEGRAGNDSIEGGVGVSRNEVGYAESPNGVTVRLSGWVGTEGSLPEGFTGSAHDGFGTVDVFNNIQNIEGSAYNDLLVGDHQDNILDGRSGNDTIDGGDGRDMLEFNQAWSGIYVDLSLGAVFDDGQGGEPLPMSTDIPASAVGVRDTLISIEDIDGGAWNDLIIGSDVANLLKGQGGDDTLEGGAADDTLDGGAGSDLARFTGNFDDYDFTWHDDGSLTVSDGIADRDGVDLLRQVERLAFADRTIDDLGSLQGPVVSGMVYHWKSHALLNDVHISMGRAQDVAEDPQQLLDMRNLRFDGVTGRLTVDVWVQPAEPASAFQFTVSAAAAQSMTFSSALGSGWAAYSGLDGDALTWAAFPQSLSVSLQSPTRLGELTIQLPAGTSATNAAFSGVVVGDASSSTGPELVVGPSTVSDSAGHFLVGGATSGSAVLHASRLADDGTPRSGINVLDAYAALKMAFGINPNADPDGNGPALPLQASPYQFMAADVNGSGTVTLNDALAILRMAVGAPNAISPEWMFVEEHRDFWDEAAGQFTLDKDNAAWDRAVQIQLPDQSQTNLVGVLKGDVNGSWQPSGSILKVTDFQPDHFISLSQESGVPLDQWGVYPS